MDDLRTDFRNDTNLKTGVDGGFDATEGEHAKHHNDVARRLLNIESVVVSTKAFGAVADGTFHPLSEFYPNLTAAQLDYPFVTDINQSIDWAATTKAIQAVKPNAATITDQQGVVALTGEPFYGVDDPSVEVVGGVTLRGASSGGTIVKVADGNAGPVFDLSLHDGVGHLEFYTQGWRPGLRDITLRPEAAMPTAGSMITGIADTRQVTDGVWVHQADGAMLDNVVVEMLAGYHFKFGPGLRESHTIGVRSWRGGHAASDKAAVMWDNDTGDGNNLVDMVGIHVGYAAYISMDFTETGTLSFQGSRIIHFFGGQIEAGGYGSTSGTRLKTTGDSPPYDVIRIKSGRDLVWHGTEIGGAPPTGKSLINATGNTSAFLGTLEFAGCLINNVGVGVSLTCDRVGRVSVKGGSWFAATAGGAAHLALTSNSGDVIWDPTIQADSGGLTDAGMPTDVRLKRDKLSFIAVTPIAGWSNTAGFAALSAARGRDNMVHLRGNINGGTATIGTVVGVLPVGLRPAATRRFAVENNTVLGSIQIDNAGNITILAANNTALSLDGISFEAA